MSTSAAPPRPTILLLGAGGQLGRALRQSLAQCGEVVATARGTAASAVDCTLDLHAADSVRAAVRRYAPRWIVNAAAYTAVDLAESSPAEATAINETAPALLAEAAREIGAGLIHFSTDYVFDGSGTRPWREDDPIRPLNAYGRSKAAGEEAIRQVGGFHWILRTSWLYGEGQNFITKMLDLAARHAEISVVDDQFGAPTSTRYLAEVTARLIAAADVRRECSEGGTLHVACSGAASWFEFAQEIFRSTALAACDAPRPRLRAVSSEAFGAAAQRPLNSRLDTSRLTALLGTAPPPWQTELARELPAVCRYHMQRSLAAERSTIESAALPPVHKDPRVSAEPKPKVVVVMPAYNAAKTLHMTYRELPHDLVDLVIVVDDGSSDETVQIARDLNLEIFVHNRNYGYGANQKTCYTEALRAGADIIVMVHPDFQYDPSLLPTVIEPIVRGEADIVLGSRLMGDSPMKQGMPWWKYVANRFLTQVENAAFGLRLSEYHTGYRAFHRTVLETLSFQANSDGFIFDQEVIAQAVDAKFRIAEVPVPTRYFPEASSASFVASSIYGCGILTLVSRYLLHAWGIWPQRQFQSLKRRYTGVSGTTQAAGSQSEAT